MDGRIAMGSEIADHYRGLRRAVQNYGVLGLGVRSAVPRGVLQGTVESESAEVIRSVDAVAHIE